MKVGIIGCGVIGGALLKACQVKGFDVRGYDPAKEGLKDFSEITNTDINFLCLPTPFVDGKQDTSIIEATLARLNNEASTYNGVVVIRSTTLPGTTDKLSVGLKFPLVHCPEFLTAATPFEDLIKQPVVLLGSSSSRGIQVAYEFWNKFDRKVPVKVLNYAFETEMAKFMHNFMLAAKVTLLNEFYDLCSLGGHYSSAIGGAVAVGQIGAGHTQVPGHDGQRGFSGMCFVKDTAALVAWAKEKGMDVTAMEAIVESNKKRRPSAYDGTEETGYK